MGVFLKYLELSYPNGYKDKKDSEVLVMLAYRFSIRMKSLPNNKFEDVFTKRREMFNYLHITLGLVMNRLSIDKFWHVRQTNYLKAFELVLHFRIYKDCDSTIICSRFIEMFGDKLEVGNRYICRKLSKS